MVFCFLARKYSGYKDRVAGWLPVWTVKKNLPASRNFYVKGTCKAMKTIPKFATLGFPFEHGHASELVVFTANIVLSPLSQTQHQIVY